MPNSAITIIAEAGVNHNGSLEMARRMVRVAAEAGADLVKFQTFTAQALVSAAAPKAEYQMRTTPPAESQLAMLQAAGAECGCPSGADAGLSGAGNRFFIHAF